MQQWKEAQATLEEAVAVAEMLDLRPSLVPALSRLCMNYAAAGEWEAAYRYALKAIAVRKSYDAALIGLDFSRHYETEALLRGGMRGKREKKCINWGNVWDLLHDSAFPTCGRWPCWLSKSPDQKPFSLQRSYPTGILKPIEHCWVRISSVRMAWIISRGGSDAESPHVYTW